MFFVPVVGAVTNYALMRYGGSSSKPGLPPTVVTAPDPGLFPEDGFEGEPHVHLAGEAHAIEASRVPVPGGGNVLYVGPPTEGVPGRGPGRATLRLPVASGDTFSWDLAADLARLSGNCQLAAGGVSMTAAAIEIRPQAETFRILRSRVRLDD